MYLTSDSFSGIAKYASLRSIEVKTYPALTHLVSHDFPELLVMMKEFVCSMETIG